MTQAGSPNPRNDPVCIMSSCPRQLILLTYLINVSHAAIISVGSLYLSPRTIMAQAIRAILLASATAATLMGRVAMRRASHGRVLCRGLSRISDDGHCAGNEQPTQMAIALLADIPPSLSLPPVECCLGTRPIHAARMRPDANALRSAT